jgi:hypothetical protein
LCVVYDYLTDVPVRHFQLQGRKWYLKTEISHPDTDTPADTVSYIFKTECDLNKMLSWELFTQTIKNSR